jgi:hypothetical protein
VAGFIDRVNAHPCDIIKIAPNLGKVLRFDSESGQRRAS